MVAILKFIYFFLSISIWYMKKEGKLSTCAPGWETWLTCSLISHYLPEAPGWFLGCLYAPTPVPSFPFLPPTNLALCPVTSVRGMPGFCCCPLLLAGAQEQTWGSPRCCHLGSCNLLGHPRQASVPHGMAGPWRVW